MKLQRTPKALERKKRPLRDARLFVVATEDRYLPRRYFDIFRHQRVVVEVLPTEDCRSAPEHVLARLKEHQQDDNHIEGDEFWLMLDIDHWTTPDHVANFRAVCAEARRRGYHLAHSNPCFEVWLLLHVAAVAESEQLPNCSAVVARLQGHLGGYNKGNETRWLSCLTPEQVSDAVMRAETLAGNANNLWPQQVGTDVFRLVKNLLTAPVGYPVTVNGRTLKGK